MSFVLYGVYYFDSKLLSILMRVAAALPPDLLYPVAFVVRGITERAIVAGNCRKYGESASRDSGGGWGSPNPRRG
jgi:hypothetical protein